MSFRCVTIAMSIHGFSVEVGYFSSKPAALPRVQEDGIRFTAASKPLHRMRSTEPLLRSASCRRRTY